jgi:hypothetical protein
MRAPQPTVHGGLTQQAQTSLQQQLSSSKHRVNAENLKLTVQGKQLMIRLPEGLLRDGQTSAQKSNRFAI